MNPEPKIVFILGPSRSGSHLVQDILSIDRTFAILPELVISTPTQKDFLQRTKHIRDFTKEENAKKLVKMMYSWELKGQHWKRIQKIKYAEKFGEKAFLEAFLETDRSLRSFLYLVMDFFRRQKRCKHMGAKSIVHFSRLKFIKKLFPEAYIIYLSRDPRALAVSHALKKYDFTPILHSKIPFLKKSNLLTRFFLQIYAAFSFNWSSWIHFLNKKMSRYLHVKYEDLVLFPRETISGICDFLDIEFNEKMLYPKQNIGSSFVSPEYKKFHKKGLDKERLTRWKKHINPLMSSLIYIFNIGAFLRFNYKLKRYYK